jgi:hypothetical protein
VKSLTVPGASDPLGPEFEFDLTAQQAHITQSLRTVTSRYDSTEGGLNNTAPDWEATHAYAAGDVVTNGGNLYRCSTAGTSAASGGPSGTGTDPITDGTAKWYYLAPAGDTVTVWEPETPYTAGEKVNSHGFVYLCVRGGTSAAEGTSDGPVGNGSGIVDGTCEWDFVGSDADPAAPDFGGAIGVTRDRVTGTDVYVGHLEFSVTAQVYPMTLELLGQMLQLVGTFNQAEWYHFPTKTLLYLGCTGTCRPGNIWTLKHRFAASPNLTDVPVGANITVPFKGGWDFLWAMYTDAQKVTTTGTFPTQVPLAAFVEQVYRPGDYTTLPIG